MSVESSGDFCGLGQKSFTVPLAAVFFSIMHAVDFVHAARTRQDQAPLLQRQWSAHQSVLPSRTVPVGAFTPTGLVCLN